MGSVDIESVFKEGVIAVAKYVSDILRELREAKGWTLRELDRRSGISNATISRIESGLSVPKPESLIALANALEVDPKILLDAPVKTTKAIDLVETLKSNDVEVLLAGERMSAEDKRHVLELIQIAKQLSGKEK